MSIESDDFEIEEILDIKRIRISN